MDDLEYNYIKHQIRILTGVDLNCYKAPQMQRRLKAYLARSGYPNWPKFFRTLRSDAVLLSKFQDYLTINVSSFFRDPEKYSYLQRNALPELLRQRTPLRVWSAGCSRGQEAYSLAMLLTEATNGNYQHRILATDIDHSALEWAKSGGPYTADEVSDLPPRFRMRHFEVRQDEYWIKEELRRKVAFRQHNLLADPVVGKFDLIICRNVVIYFQAEAKRKLYQRFYDVLKPGGVLFVGGTEIVPKATEIGLEAMSVSFYRRKETSRKVAKSIGISSSDRANNKSRFK
jgi:chemotaxis protein methyltransferase CheR